MIPAHSKLFALALLSGASITFSLSSAAAELSLSSLKKGSLFEVLEPVSVPVPPALALLGEIPTLQVTEHAFGFARPDQTLEPLCLISGLSLGAELPDKLELPKGSKIEVDSVQSSKGSVSFGVHSLASPVKARLQCISAKGSKSAMPVEVFEKLFRRKVRLLAEERVKFKSG